jgi:hypothetical protein
MFQVFQMFHTYVASVLSGYYICFAMATNVFFLVLHMYVANVSTVSDVCYKVFHLDIAKLVLVLQMLQWDPLPQPPASTALPACMRVGAEGA